MTPTFGSLFTGIGGFDLALERAGWECKWQVEIDDYCTRVLERHWPNVHRERDVRKCGSHNLEPVDLICGGFPCQDLSVAGKRAGLAGERSGLWYEYHRIVSELHPMWVLIENVPGLLSASRGRDFATILRGLGECGYSAAWRILDAQYFGLAQRRRRVFIVGSLGTGSCAEILFEPTSCCGDTAPSREAGAGVAHALTGCPTATGRLDPDGEDLVTATLNSGGNNGGFRTEPGEHLVAATLKQRGRGSCDEVMDNLQVSQALRSNPYANHDGDDRKLVLAHTLRGGKTGYCGSEDGSGRGVPIVPFDTTQLTSPGNYSQPKPGAPCHPLAAGAHPPTIAGVGVRRLTPTECERLQGFPDGWTFGSDSTRYRQLGNAVAVPVVEWIGRRILEATH